MICGADPSKAKGIALDKVAKVFDHYVNQDARFPGEVRMVDGPTWVLGVGYVAAYVGPELTSIADDVPPPQISLKVQLKSEDFGL